MAYAMRLISRDGRSALRRWCRRRFQLLSRTSIIGFADDALVVCAVDDIKILELKINQSLWRTKRWLDSRRLEMAPEETVFANHEQEIL